MSLGSAAERMSLFVQCRLAVAAAALGLGAPLALAAGSTGAATALLLAGLLPAVVALDGDDRRLARCCAFALVITGLTLAGGVLRGLPVTACLLLIFILSVEALLAVGRRDRLRTGVIGASAAVAPVAAAFFTAPATAGQGLLSAAVASVAIVNVLALAACVGNLMSRRMSTIHRRLWALRRGAFVVSETVVALDRSGRVVEVGRNASKALGLPRQALLGRGLVDLTQVADRPLLLAACSAAFPAAGDRRTRFRLRESAGGGAPRYRWAEITLSGQANRDICLASLRDISDVVADEKRRVAAVAASERADAVRDAFLSTVNHELRTPLNAIVGFSEFLANPSTTPADQARVREYAGIIHEAGHDLLRKVAAMIEITRIQSGAYEFAVEPSDAEALVRSTISRFIADRGLAVDAIGLAAASPITADLDPRAFASALAELLENAFKHGLGEKASVTLSVEGDQLVAAVRDSGPGVQPERLAALHQDLSRADEALTRTKGGLGLGLTLARSVMALHGGSVIVANRKGGGAEVALRAPLEHKRAASVTPIELSAHRKASSSVVQPTRKQKRA